MEHPPSVSPRRNRSTAVAVALVAVRVLALALAATGCASRPAITAAPATAPVALSDAQRQANLESFDQVWTTIRDKHFDPKLNGADWNAARAEFRPKVEAATNEDQVRAAIIGLIATLHETHFGLIPAESYDVVSGGSKSDEKSSSKSSATGEKTAAASPPKPAHHDPAESGTLGLELRVVDGAALISRIAPGSPAADAGVRTGWELLAVDSKYLAPVLLKAGKLHTGTSIPTVVYQERYIESLLDVEVGQSSRLVFRDGDSHIRVFNLTAAQAPGALSTFGNLPPMRVDTERRLLPGNIGYMSLSIWLDPARVFKFWQASMAEFASADGIIIDLRGNPGGLGAMSMGIGGFYVADRNVKLGTMIMRTGEMRFVLNPQPRPYAGPVAILVDELSMSTSEIFAGGMRDIGRAKIFGTKTPGAALPSAIEKLPNGDGFQYAYANYLSASGIALEGNGVTPDESTPLTRAALLAGKDPALDAAVEWIASKPSPMLPKKSPTASAGASN